MLNKTDGKFLSIAYEEALAGFGAGADLWDGELRSAWPIMPNTMRR